MHRIPDSQVRRAIYLAENTGAADILQRAIRTTRVGRPRSVDARMFVVGSLLCVQTIGRVELKTMHQLLTTGISVAMQWELGVRRKTDDGFVSVPRDDIESFSEVMGKKLDWARPGLTEDERRRRMRRIVAFSDALLEASLVERVTTTGALAIDASAIWAWRVNRKKPKGDATEAKADQPVADGEPRPSEATEEPAADVAGLPAWSAKTAKTGGKEWYYGYAVHAAVRIPEVGAAKGSIPLVTERIRFTTSTAKVGPASLEMIDSIAEAGRATVEVIGDREYSNSVVEDWADELRGRGIKQHLDLRSDDQGFRDVDGMKLVAGALHCPGTPDHLADIPRPGLNATAEELVAFAERIERRRAYQAPWKERANGDGRVRVICPALDGRVACPLRPETMQAAAGHVPVVASPPDAATAPPICSKSSVSVNEPRQRKHEQPHYWGTEAWKAAYNRRTYVEGFCGSLKNSSNEDVRRGFTRMKGMAKTFFAMSVAFACANVRHQRNWYGERHPGAEHPLLGPDDEDHGWTPLTAEEREILDRHRANGEPPADEEA